MKPQPKSHFLPSFTDNTADNEDIGSSSNSSSSSTNDQRQPRPRMRSPEKDFMTIDGASEDGSSDDESSTDEPRHGTKRAWSTDISPSDETEKLPSTEPRNKKQRLQEPQEPASVGAANGSSDPVPVEDLRERVIALLTQGTYASSSSSTSSCSSSSASAPAAGWQQQVRRDLSDEALEKLQAGLYDENHPEQVLALLFGENKAQWPLGQFNIRKISLILPTIEKLLLDCGAVIVGYDEDEIGYVMYAADFDAPRFRDGLVDLLKEEQNQSSDDSSDESSDDDIYSSTFTFSAEWGDLEIVKELLKNGAVPYAKDYNKESALMKASASGNIEIVRLLLESRTGINTTTEEGWNSLALAAAEGHSDICQLLLNNGALLEIAGAVSVLHLAAKNGHVQTCRLLIAAGIDLNITDNLNMTPMGVAAKNGQLAVCKLLLELGANINHTSGKGKSILFLAISSGNLELVQYLLADGTGLTLQVGDKTPLIMAAQKNKTNILRWLLAEGAPVNQADKNNHTALMSACSAGTLETVSLLLQHGAKMDMTNNAGMTPLLLAVINRNAGIVELLIKNGVPLFSDRHEGFKALTLAVERTSVNIASLLLKAHVPVEPVRFIGNSRSPSLLNIAIQPNHKWSIVEILELLLKNGASTRRTDENGDNALMLATKLKMKSAIDLLGKYGAQVGQTNKDGKNALQIAIEALDLSVADSESPEDIATNAELVVSLLKIMQTQTDWAELREEALNSAQRPLTRELILLAWAWKNTDAAVIGNLAGTNIHFPTIQDLISLIITSTPADFSRKKIEYMLSMAGVCPPLIEKIYPYIEALPKIKTKLSRHPLNFNSLLLNAFLGGAFAMLETIRLEHGEHWMPYGDSDGSTPLFKTLNQIANLELTQLVDIGVTTEQFYTIPIFENLFETCFNLAGTAQKPFATLPPYSAVDGDLTLALDNKGVYFMLAARIEEAWKKAWEKIVSSQESNRASSSSSSSQSAETAILPDITSSIDADTADMDSAWVEEMLLPDVSPFSDLPQGQALLQAFRNELRIAFHTPGESILELKDASPAEAQIYASLMHRQLHMLNQFIEAKGGN